MWFVKNPFLIIYPNAAYARAFGLLKCTFTRVRACTYVCVCALCTSVYTVVYVRVYVRCVLARAYVCVCARVSVYS
jgi:hypothetical protein